MRAPGHVPSRSSGAGHGRPQTEPSPPPDVVGYLLDEARAVLAEAGWRDVETTETRPPRRALTGPLRVLRQQTAATGGVALVVCGERPAVPPAGPAARPPVPGGNAAAARGELGPSGAASGGYPA